MKRVVLMPNPVRRSNGVFYINVTVPADLGERAKGSHVAIPVGDKFTTTKVGTHAKASLQTKDDSEARRRFPAALAAVEAHWESLRQGPVDLSHKQCVALAGEVRQAFIEAFDDNPGDIERWARMQRLDDLAQRGLRNELQVPVSNPTELAETRSATLDARFGGLVDATLTKHHLNVSVATRRRITEATAKAMGEANAINKARAEFDYPEDGEIKRYPAFEPPDRKLEGSHGLSQQTLADVLDEEIKRRASGRKRTPLRENSVRKYRRVVEEFNAFRGDQLVASINARDADRWVAEMLDNGELSNDTIRQRLMNLKTVVQWARTLSLGELFPTHHPLQQVDAPAKDSDVPQGERAFKLDEARRVLLAARSEVKPELRWLPWLCAYSGARINEVAQLRPSDFRATDGVHFYLLSTTGGRTLKNRQSVRRVPLHPDLIAEGLLAFVDRHRQEPETRLFPARAQGNVRDWVRIELGLSREHLQPNHGWRHLLEDRAIGAGMADGAKNYLTGRRSGKSEEDYVGSEALVPLLAEQLARIPSYLDE